MPLITDNARLTDFCARLAEEEFVAVDTEFIREKTYYPRSA
jgi:ribonuclease D